MHKFLLNKIYLHLLGTIIVRQKQFLRGTLANFCKSKKCIIFNVHYCLVSKKSKFDMTLIRHSPFNGLLKVIGIQKVFIFGVFTKTMAVVECKIILVTNELKSLIF